MIVTGFLVTLVLLLVLSILFSLAAITFFVLAFIYGLKKIIKISHQSN